MIQTNLTNALIVMVLTVLNTLVRIRLNSNFLPLFNCDEYITARATVFERHQFFGTSEHYGKAHGIPLSG